MTMQYNFAAHLPSVGVTQNTPNASDSLHSSSALFKKKRGSKKSNLKKKNRRSIKNGNKKIKKIIGGTTYNTLQYDATTYSRILSRFDTCDKVFAKKLSIKKFGFEQYTIDPDNSFYECFKHNIKSFISNQTNVDINNIDELIIFEEIINNIFEILDYDEIINTNEYTNAIESIEKQIKYYYSVSKDKSLLDNQKKYKEELDVLENNPENSEELDKKNLKILIFENKVQNMLFLINKFYKNAIIKLPQSEEYIDNNFTYEGKLFFLDIFIEKFIDKINAIITENYINPQKKAQAEINANIEARKQIERKKAIEREKARRQQEEEEYNKFLTEKRKINTEFESSKTTVSETLSAPIDKPTANLIPEGCDILTKVKDDFEKLYNNIFLNEEKYNKLIDEIANIKNRYCDKILDIFDLINEILPDDNKIDSNNCYNIEQNIASITDKDTIDFITTTDNDGYYRYKLENYQQKIKQLYNEYNSIKLRESILDNYSKYILTEINYILDINCKQLDELKQCFNKYINKIITDTNCDLNGNQTINLNGFLDNLLNDLFSNITKIKSDITQQAKDIILKINYDVLINENINNKLITNISLVLSKIYDNRKTLPATTTTTIETIKDEILSLFDNFPTSISDKSKEDIPQFFETNFINKFIELVKQHDSIPNVEKILDGNKVNEKYTINQLLDGDETKSILIEKCKIILEKIYNVYNDPDVKYSKIINDLFKKYKIIKFNDDDIFYYYSTKYGSRPFYFNVDKEKKEGDYRVLIKCESGISENVNFYQENDTNMDAGYDDRLGLFLLYGFLKGALLLCSSKPVKKIDPLNIEPYETELLEPSGPLGPSKPLELYEAFINYLDLLKESKSNDTNHFVESLKQNTPNKMLKSYTETDKRKIKEDHNFLELFNDKGIIEGLISNIIKENVNLIDKIVENLENLSGEEFYKKIQDKILANNYKAIFDLLEYEKKRVVIIELIEEFNNGVPNIIIQNVAEIFVILYEFIKSKEKEYGITPDKKITADKIEDTLVIGPSTTKPKTMTQPKPGPSKQKSTTQPSKIDKNSDEYKTKLGRYFYEFLTALENTRNISDCKTYINKFISSLIGNIRSGNPQINIDEIENKFINNKKLQQILNDICTYKNNKDNKSLFNPTRITLSTEYRNSPPNETFTLLKENISKIINSEFINQPEKDPDIFTKKNQIANKIADYYAEFFDSIYNDLPYLNEHEKDKPSTDKLSQPKTSQPTTSQPTTSQPKTSQPRTSQPRTSQPTTSQPTTSKPRTSQPTAKKQVAVQEKFGEGPKSTEEDQPQAKSVSTEGFDTDENFKKYFTIFLNSLSELEIRYNIGNFTTKFKEKLSKDPFKDIISAIIENDTFKEKMEQFLSIYKDKSNLNKIKFISKLKSIITEKPIREIQFDENTEQNEKQLIETYKFLFDSISEYQKPKEVIPTQTPALEQISEQEQEAVPAPISDKIPELEQEAEPGPEPGPIIPQDIETEYRKSVAEEIKSNIKKDTIITIEGSQIYGIYPQISDINSSILYILYAYYSYYDESQYDESQSETYKNIYQLQNDLSSQIKIIIEYIKFIKEQQQNKQQQEEQQQDILKYKIKNTIKEIKLQAVKLVLWKLLYFDLVDYKEYISNYIDSPNIKKETQSQLGKYYKDLYGEIFTSIEDPESPIDIIEKIKEWVNKQNISETEKSSTINHMIQIIEIIDEIITNNENSKLDDKSFKPLNNLNSLGYEVNLSKTQNQGKSTTDSFLNSAFDT